MTAHKPRNSLQPNNSQMLNTVTRNQRSVSSLAIEQTGGKMQTRELESAVYSPKNYHYNTNYNREFTCMIKSKGTSCINSLQKSRQQRVILGNTGSGNSMLRLSPPYIQEGNKEELRKKNDELHVSQNIQKIRQNTHSQAYRNWQQLGPYNMSSTAMSKRNARLVPDPNNVEVKKIAGTNATLSQTAQDANSLFIERLQSENGRKKSAV